LSSRTQSRFLRMGVRDLLFLVLFSESFGQDLRTLHLFL